MDRTIRQITDNLVSLLPDEDQYYGLDELRKLGFPRFIVNRIQVELERNLAESMRPPQTDWANIGSDRVQNVWQEFINAIRAEARLPASYAKTVIETAVADVLEMLIQPRKNIPEIIFGTEKKLSLEKVKQRMDAIVVYRHFSTLIPRYIEKKNLDELTLERCKKVVASADEKMTTRYSPLNWAQMLEPLFSLMDEQIDTNLLRLFFEDKKMPRIARQFDLMDSAVDRAKLIEVLSSPDSLNFEGYEEDQSDLFEAEARDTDAKTEEKEEGDPVLDNFHAAREKSKDKPEAQEEPEEQEQQSEEDEGQEETLNTIFGDEEEPEKQDADDEIETGLNQMFNTENGQEESPLAAKESEAEEKSKDKDDTSEDDKSAVDLDENVEITEDPNPETPMWQRYMSPEDIEAMEAEQEEQQTAILGEESELDDEQGAPDEEGFIEEPIIDLTKDDSASDDEIEKLQEYLEDDREFFVADIFRDSERAYEEALEEIAAKEDWKSVSKFIDKNVFKRNMVDMYSEAAVDFTDRLQSYFIEKSKS